MKTTYLKLSLKSSLMVLLFLLGYTVWGQTTVSYDFSAGGAVTGLDANPPIALDANIGFSSHKNDGTADPALIDGQLRLYQNSTKGGSIKIYAKNNAVITKVVVYASGSAGDGPAGYSVDNTTEVGTWPDGTTIYTMNNLTATDYVEFYNKGTSSSTRTYVDYFEVTYSLPVTGDHTITVTQPVGGTITPGTSSVENGGSIAFTATPESICYAFSHWVVDGANAGSANPYEFTNVTEDHTITAVFNVTGTYEIVATAGANGSISPSGTTVVNCGEDQTYTIIPNAGYMIADVLVNGVSVGAVASYAFENVTQNHTIAASFVEYEVPDYYDGIGVFEKITSVSDITEGYYVIVESFSNSYAMTNNHNGTFLAREAVTPVDNTIVNPNTGIVWYIAPNGGGYTIYNEVIEKYVSYTGNSNNIQIVDDVTADNQRWAITYEENQFHISNVALTTRKLQYNSNNNQERFAAYTGTQKNIFLYKLSTGATPDPTLAVAPSSITGLNYGLGNGPSASQSFVLSGENLDGSENVTLLADTGFEISFNDADFEGELTLTAYEGENTTIYVRLASGLASGAHSGVILIDGYGIEQEITVSGNVLGVPVITEADLNAQVGVPFSYQIIATDEPSNYSISSEELPAGLELDAETGIISGTPTIAGEFIFGVTAENESGTSQEAVFTIEIAKGIQTVTGLGNINASVEDASITLPTTTDQGFTIIYELELNPVAAITGNTLSFLSVGTIDFMAYTQDNDDNYEDYLEVFTINVTEAPTLNHLVISQIYGAGGNSGAIYNRDYVELYNPTNSSISLEEYSLQYASSSGAFNSKANLSGIVPPHSYFLIALGSGGSNGDALPSPDLPPTSPGILNLAASNGKIVLANSTDTVESPDSSNVVDFVGFGSANMYEGSGTAPAPSATKAIFRKENGAQDTDDNANDFIEGSPNPRNLLFNSVVWETTNEWTGTPSIDENVVILGNLNVTELNSFSAKTLTIINGSLDIEAGGSVTVAENIIIKNGTNETFVVENDANLIQLNANTSDNIGAITVQKNSSLIKHLDYTIWSSPVNEQGLKAFSPLTLWYRIYTYNGSQDEWSNVFSSAEDSDSNFVAGVGYMFRAPNNFETDPYVYNGIFTGIPQSGDITVTFNNIGTYQSIGNPYPSNIKIDGNGGFWNVNPNTGTLYFWTNVNPWDNDEGTYTGNNWATYNKTGGVAVPADNSSKVSNGIIPVGQGFVVETDGVISEVTFKNSMRTTNEGVFFKITNAEKHRLWLDLSQNDTNINQILIGYLQGATQEYDFGFDSQLFQYNGNALYSLIDNDSEQYTIQGRSLPFNDNDIVPLGFRTNNAGTFTISLANFDGIFTEGQNIYLKDNFTQTIQNLKTGDYTFVSEEGIFNNRFEIVYKESADLNVNNPDLNNKWLVYSKDGNFQIETVGFEMKEVVFYDMLGRVVYQKQVNGTTHTATQFSANGVLIVKVITTDNQVLTKKTIN